MLGLQNIASVVRTEIYERRASNVHILYKEINKTNNFTSNLNFRRARTHTHTHSLAASYGGINKLIFQTVNKIGIECHIFKSITRAFT